MLKRPPSEAQLIVATLALVVALGARTFFSLTEDEVQAVPTSVQASAGTLASSRSPASVPNKLNSKADSALDQFKEYNLNCNKKSVAKLAVSGSYIQFQGKHCLKGADESTIEIVNKSNGYTASIFSRGADKYQTDLIQLQKGENEITIRYREASGESVEEVVHVVSSKI